MPFLYRVLLWFYPPDFRREFGAEMTSTVDAAWRTASRRGWAAQCRLAVRVLTDWITSLWPSWRGRPQPRPLSPRKDPMIRTALRELRLAARVLWLDRGATFAIVLTLLLATGATAAVFSVVNAVVLRPLPFATADRLVAIWEHNVVRNRPRNVVAPANFHEWRDRATSFDHLAAVIDYEGALTGDGPAEQLAIAYGSWDLFDMLGVRPIEGRGFLEPDSAANAGRKALLSWNLWQRRFHGDQAIIGRSIHLADETVEVIGVLPRAFRLPGHDADVWWQVRYSAAQRAPRGRNWQVLGRLKENVSVERARAEMDAIAQQLEQKYPAFDSGWRATVTPLQDDLNGAVRTPLLLMMGAVAILLMIVCANTTNLLLAKASRRQRDMAVRTALGAGYWHLVRQLLAEGFLLSLLGAGGGLLMARLGLFTLARFGDTLGVARLDEATLDAPVLALTSAVTVACTLLFSLVPAASAGRMAVSGALASGGRWSTGARRDRRMRHALVVTQVAGAVVLVIGGGMVTRSLMRLVAVDAGFDREVYAFSIAVPDTRYPTADHQMRFYRDVLDRVKATPGVTQASYMGFLPFAGPGTATSFTRADAPPPPTGQEPVADIRPVDADYFATMGIRLIHGRVFTGDEVRRGQKVCVISAATAASVFGSENPIGHWLNINLDGGPDMIVGVVSDIHHARLSESPRPMIYYPFGRFPLSAVSVLMRGALSDDAMRTAAEAIVRDLDRDIPVTEPVRLQQLVSNSIASPRAAAQLVSAFGVLALTLAMVGIGALLAALVAARRTEFGVRLAMGASPSDIRLLVLRQGAAMIGIGLLIGSVLAALASKALTSVLFDAQSADPLVFGGALLSIAVLGVLAADIPARHATRVNPVDILR